MRRGHWPAGRTSPGTLPPVTEAPGPARGAREEFAAARFPGAVAGGDCARPPLTRDGARSAPVGDDPHRSGTRQCPFGEFADGGLRVTPPSAVSHVRAASSEGDPRTSARSVLGRNSNGDALAALLAAPIQNLAAPPRFHAGAKAVLVAATTVTWTITRFHLVPRVRGESYSRKGRAARLTFPHATI